MVFSGIYYDNIMIMLCSDIETASINSIRSFIHLMCFVLHNPM